MSGITSESRLARLVRLRTQIDREIAAEEAAEARRTINRADLPPPPPREPAPPRPPAGLVRAWALRYGHTTCTRGRLPELLYAMYTDANPTGAHR